eukprot:scaffold31012_cov130-Skeletonema_dohrnii-CCMP3373.AAC.4
MGPIGPKWSQCYNPTDPLKIVFLVDVLDEFGAPSPILDPATVRTAIAMHNTASNNNTPKPQQQQAISRPPPAPLPFHYTAGAFCMI